MTCHPWKKVRPASKVLRRDQPKSEILTWPPACPPAGSGQPDARAYACTGCTREHATYLAALVDQKVLGLEVAVEHGRAHAVQVVHALGHVHAHAERLRASLQQLVAQRVCRAVVEQGVQRAGEELGDDAERRPRADLDELDDVGVAQLREEHLRVYMPYT